MDALTPDGPLFRTTWFLMRVSRPIRYPCLLCRTFHPFCLQSPYAVPVRIWIFCTGLTVEILCRRNRVLADQAYQASPFSGRLATATGRIEFVNLRTGRSPRVALHPASRRRSDLRLRETRHSSTRTRTSPIRQHHRRTRTGPTGRKTGIGKRKWSKNPCRNCNLTQLQKLRCGLAR